MADDIVEAKAEVLPAREEPRKLSRLDKKAEELRRIEDSIFETSMSVVHAAVGFAEVDKDDTEPPEEWVERFGEEAAWRRFRVAKEGWLSAKESAVGIKVAAQIAAAGMKARAMEKTPIRSLSVNIVTIAVSDGQFDELEVGDGYDDA